MKHSLYLHLLAGVAAGLFGGWLTWVARHRVSSNLENTSTGQVQSSPAKSQTKARPSNSSGNWQVSLANVPQSAGAASEVAWVKWAMTVPDEAIPAAIQRLDPIQGLHALRFLYCRWAKLDFPKAWEALVASKIPAAHHSLAMHEDYYRLDVGRRYQQPRKQIAERMLYALRATQPEEVTRILSRGLKDPMFKGTGLSQWELDRLKESQPANPLASIPDSAPEGTLDPAAQVELLTPATRATAGQDEAIKQWLTASRPVNEEDRAGNVGLHDLMGVVRQWANTTPRAAVRWAEQQPEGPAKPLLLGETAGWLAATDLLEAQRLVQTAADPVVAVQAMVNSWMQVGPDACLAWLDRIPDAETARLCRLNAANQLVTLDPMQAMAVARKLPAEDRRQILDSVRDQVDWSHTQTEAVEKEMHTVPPMQAPRSSVEESGG